MGMKSFMKHAFNTTGRTFAVLAALGLLVPACGQQKKAPEKPRTAPVKVATASLKDVPVDLNAIGEVYAYSTVSVKSQVDGPLARIHFKEGQYVNRGDVLFTIDPSPFEIALKQAEANLAKDTAQMKNARVEAKRYEELVKKGYVAQADYDSFRTAAEALTATVNADWGAVDNARLQLSYTNIRSPITGRAGSLIINQGNLIKANDVNNTMVVIYQVEPIYAGFSVPEQYLPEIKSYMAKGPLKVIVKISDRERPEEGVLTFIDNQVDRATGTILLKGAFNNKDRRLWPGQFVNVTLRLSTEKNAVTVPTQAVMTGQNGQYVFVVKPDNTAETRPVVAGRISGNETVIEQGVKAGEAVVTDGQLQVIPGIKVEIRNGGPGASK